MGPQISAMLNSSNSPLISVVIPFFNSEKWIRETLLSVYRQTYENIEIILVDDGSTDASVEVVRSIIASQPKKCLKMISISNTGVSSARNLGIENSSGELIAFLDSDDVWYPDKLTIQFEHLISHPDNIAVLCDFYISKVKRDSDKLINARLISKRGVRDIAKGWLSLEGNGALISSTALLWKNRFAKEVEFDSRLGTAADLSFYLKLLKLGEVGHINESLVQYRQHNAQMHTNAELLKRDFFLLLEETTLIPENINRRRILGNVYLMSSLLNFSKLNLREAFKDFRVGFVLRPLGVVRIPISIIRKRFVGILMLLITQNTSLTP